MEMSASKEVFRVPYRERDLGFHSDVFHGTDDMAQVITGQSTWEIRGFLSYIYRLLLSREGTLI